MRVRRVLVSLLLAALGLLIAGPPASSAQEFRIGVGGGWAVPTNNVEPQLGSGQNATVLTVDLEPGAHAYAGLGFVRSIGENFDLGARVRGQFSRLSATPECGSVSCTDPDASLWGITVEGRIIITSPDWIHPYLLVGLGAVQATVDAVTASPEQGELTFPEVSVTDAGGDVGLGASFPLAGGLFADAEFRVTGALPGGKDNAVTALPLSLGLGYQF
ncbi:MAG: outer membrane beta-barrel protein [Salinivenus sp.]